MKLPECAIDRFIPAGAGNTHRSRLGEARRAVHPRGRGEHGGGNNGGGLTNGSSPRARGTLQRALSTVEEHRFIPAGAGNT